MASKVVTFGEIMLRLSPPGYNRFVQTDEFEAHYGGGEANVAASLAQFGLDSWYVTKLPKHEIGEAAVGALRQFGINVSCVIRGGERVGIYFLETGASQRASKVIYDRSGSSISSITPGEIDWEKALEGAAWFHWTGITPALGANVQSVLKEACTLAKRKSVMVSVDLNYRKKLWTETQAQAAMIPLMECVDVCISNEEDAEKTLGLKAGITDVEKARIDEEGYFSLARTMKQKFGFRAVAITLRESHSASHNGWSAILADDRDCKSPYRSTRYDIHIVDRVGGGDAFAAGLIYGFLSGGKTDQALEFAVAASCLKQTIPGDFNRVSVDEVNALTSGGGSGRVQR